MVAQIHRRNVDIVSLAKAMRARFKGNLRGFLKSRLKIKFSEPELELGTNAAIAASRVAAIADADAFGLKRLDRAAEVHVLRRDDVVGGALPTAQHVARQAGPGG